MRHAGTRLALCLIGFFLTIPAFAQPRTTAETSDYQATTRHADIVAFGEQLAKFAPDVVRLGSLGESQEKRPLPLLILADPPIASADEASKSGKLVVFVQANIHAGEVDGKEAVLALARELARAKDRSLLRKLILVLAPNVNPDGNERIADTNRRSQNGPPEVGTRANAQGLDLNRDFIKLESPEVRGIVKFLRQWNPAVVIDCHTTNGSQHRYTLTYDGPRHPGIAEPLIAFVRDKMLPDVGKRLEKATGFASYFYGNFDRAKTKWESYPAQPRYGTQYVGLRGRIAILSESYSYAPFKDRVRASHEFVLGCLNFVAENESAVKKILDETAKAPPRFAVAHKLVARSAPVKILGFETDAAGKADLTKPKDFTLQQVDRAEATATLPRAHAYLIPPSLLAVVENLQRHGINMLELREDIELACEAPTVQKITKSERQYQGHAATTLETDQGRSFTRRIPAGTLIVPLDQPLARLAAILLEANSEDSLATWNYLDATLKVGEAFPILRLPQDTPLTTTPARPLAEDRVLGKRIKPEHFLEGQTAPQLNGRAVRDLDWLADGEHFLQTKGGKLLKVHAASGKATPFFDRAALAKALAAALKIPANRAEAIAAGRANLVSPVQPSYQMNPAQTGFLFREADDLHFTTFDGAKVLRLTKTNGREETPTFSPDGEWVAFVREQNLYAVDLATQTERKLTTDGGGKIFNGKADWVYYEEIFNRKYKAFWWSNDSKSLAFIRYDDTPVAPFTIVDHLRIAPRLEQTPYPKSGAPNPHVKLGLVAAGGGPVRFVNTPGYKPDETLLLRAMWTPDSKDVLFYLTDRAQTWLDVMAVSPSEAVTLTPRKLFRETTKAWVDDPEEPIFLKDGRFLLHSARDGWKHLYLFARDGKLLRRVTEGAWEVRHVHLVEEKTGWVYFSATADSPIGQNLYRVPFDKAGPMETLTREGNHRFEMSPTGSYVIDTASSHRKPAQVTLKTLTGDVIRRIDTNPVHALDEYKLGKFDLVKIPLQDGFVLEGSILLPVDFDPKLKYPVWLMTYGGPHAPTISDAWSFRTLDHVLSSLGIIVFRCDPRTASGKGAVSAWAGYKQLGVQEHKDVEGAIDWLIANHPYVDGSRIGMSGSSYGGYLTAYCMTHGKKLAAGIAGAPVTDWKLYDSIYTERYMDTPQKNPEGYNKGSVIREARNLHGKLLLVHGLMDDNVHVQNSVQFIEELQRAGKDFELMVYPQARHGVGPPYTRHHNKLTLDFIRRTMGK